MAIQSSNLYEDNSDIHFHVESMIDWDTVVPLREQGFVDYKTYQQTQDENLAFAAGSVAEGVDLYKSVFQGIGEIAAKVIMPNARPIDEKGFTFKEGQVSAPPEWQQDIKVLTDNGYMGLLLPRKYGGMQIPNVANAIVTEMVSTGDIGLGTLLACQDLGDIIYKFASDELKDKYLPAIASGEMGAAMLLTEPNYGSDLQNAQTKGHVKENGKVSVTGVKQFITHGVPHSPGGTVFLTVTRTVKKADGSFKQGGAGLSLVLVHSENAEISALEHKLGIHSSPTVQLTMDNSEGDLVGKEGMGLIEYTMTLMNAARLTVSAQSLGASEIAYREAVAYANVREQFGVLIKDIPAVAKMLQEIELSVKASRALIYATAQAVDIMEGLEEKYHAEGLSPKEIKKQLDYVKWSKLVKVLTPFSKLYAAEESNSNAYKSMQIHGGVGYSEEYDIARIYRDARILSIYEGTSQLQVVAAIGGVIEGYGLDSSAFWQYQQQMLDEVADQAGLKVFADRIRECVQLLKNIVPFYKEQSKEFKGAYAFDLVWSAILVFNSHLFIKMAGKDAQRTNQAKIYINDALAYTRTMCDKIKMQAE